MSRVRAWCRKKCCCDCEKDAEEQKKYGEGMSPGNQDVVVTNEQPRLQKPPTRESSTRSSGKATVLVSAGATPSREGSVRQPPALVHLNRHSSATDSQRHRGAVDLVKSNTLGSSDVDRRSSLQAEKRVTVSATSKEPVDINDQKRISDAIDRQLRRQKSKILNRSVVLLLGTGESGKSTFLKQLRIIHKREFTDDELLGYRTTILNNAFFGVATLLTAVELFGCSLSAQNQVHSDRLKQLASSLQSAKQSCSLSNFTECKDSLEAVWNDQAVQAAFARRAEFHVSDNVRYFMSQLKRIANAEYKPSDEDVLHARKPTKNVTELPIEINRKPFVFVDVGGQRVERAKWCRVFNDTLTCILFLVASSEFDQSLVEDASVNRLLEAANVFETVVNNRAFADVSLVMFFNKTDVLEEKVLLGASQLVKHFPKFVGDVSSVNDVKQFLVTSFQQRVRDLSKPLYHHFTTAVDTNNIQLVFRSVKDILLEKNIDSIMLH